MDRKTDMMLALGILAGVGAYWWQTRAATAGALPAATRTPVGSQARKLDGFDAGSSGVYYPAKALAGEGVYARRY
jgi:hypothetical protein